MTRQQRLLHSKKSKIQSTGGVSVSPFSRALRRRYSGHNSNQSPLSPPARLRRLGVRQAEDQFSTNSHESHSTNETLELIKRLSTNKQHGFISPSDRQLKRLFPQSTTLDTKNKNAVEEDTDTYIRPGILRCSKCEKTFLSYHGYDTHLESHEGLAVKCWLCNIRFMSNKSLLQHKRFRHKKENQELEGGQGFHNLIFMDFSCEKFPDICTNYCEKFSLQTASDIHNHTCTSCRKSFPTDRALKLHNSQQHYTPSKYICNHCNHDYSAKVTLEQHKLKYTGALKKYLTDQKRAYIRSLALMPKCMMESLEKPKYFPETNLSYHKKLKEIETVTSKVYPSQPIVSEEDDSDSSQS